MEVVEGVEEHSARMLVGDMDTIGLEKIWKTPRLVEFYSYECLG